MAGRIDSLTQYPEIDVLLQHLNSRTQLILADRKIGMYVHGSLANGDFDPVRSDIDFLVVTEGRLSDNTVSALDAMHWSLREGGMMWADKLEGSYIPKTALRRHNPNDVRHPALNADGTLRVDTHGSDWVIQRYIIRERGIVVAGPQPDTLIDRVGAGDLRNAVRQTLVEWWSPPFPSPGRFESAEYRAYAVLTMCRILFTFRYGTVASKPAAARWTQSEFGAPWTGIVERALAGKGEQSQLEMDEVAAFIQYTINAVTAVPLRFQARKE